jgi:hypothetical protein
MKPSTLKPGERVQCRDIGAELAFVERIGNGRHTTNVFRADAYAGQRGPTDTGLCTMSDHAVQTRCQRIGGAP